jgi:hypothetical protein
MNTWNVPVAGTNVPSPPKVTVPEIGAGCVDEFVVGCPIAAEQIAKIPAIQIPKVAFTVDSC